MIKTLLQVTNVMLHEGRPLEGSAAGCTRLDVLDGAEGIGTLNRSWLHSAYGHAATAGGFLVAYSFKRVTMSGLREWSEAEFLQLPLQLTTA